MIDVKSPPIPTPRGGEWGYVGGDLTFRLRPRLGKVDFPLVKSPHLPHLPPTGGGGA